MIGSVPVDLICSFYAVFELFSHKQKASNCNVQVGLMILSPEQKGKTVWDMWNGTVTSGCKECLNGKCKLLCC